MASRSPLQAGRLVDDRYTLESHLRGPGLGEIWVAVDTQFRGRRVRLKFLRSAPGISDDEFLSAARGLQRLRHANVLSVVGQGVYSGRPFIIHDEGPSATLEEWLDELRANNEKPPLAEVFEIFAAIAAGVHAAHALAPDPIVHSAITPSAVVLDRRADGTREVRVCDFAIVGFDELGSERVGRAPGYTEYLAPEQLDGYTEPPATDVFALAVVLVEMLSTRSTTSKPWAAAAREGTVRAQLDEQRDGVPPAVWDLVARALDGFASRRPTTAGMFLRALANVWPGTVTLPDLSDPSMFADRDAGAQPAAGAKSTSGAAIAKPVPAATPAPTAPPATPAPAPFRPAQSSPALMAAFALPPPTAPAAAARPTPAATPAPTPAATTRPAPAVTAKAASAVTAKAMPAVSVRPPPPSPSPPPSSAKASPASARATMPGGRAVALTEKSVAVSAPPSHPTRAPQTGFAPTVQFAATPPPAPRAADAPRSSFAPTAQMPMVPSTPPQAPRAPRPGHGATKDAPTTAFDLPPAARPADSRFEATEMVDTAAVTAMAARVAQGAAPPREEPTEVLDTSNVQAMVARADANIARRHPPTEMLDAANIAAHVARASAAQRADVGEHTVVLATVPIPNELVPRGDKTALLSAPSDARTAPGTPRPPDDGLLADDAGPDEEPTTTIDTAAVLAHVQAGADRRSLPGAPRPAAFDSTVLLGDSPLRSGSNPPQSSTPRGGFPPRPPPTPGAAPAFEATVSLPDSPLHAPPGYPQGATPARSASPAFDATLHEQHYGSDLPTLPPPTQKTPGLIRPIVPPPGHRPQAATGAWPPAPPAPPRRMDLRALFEQRELRNRILAMVAGAAITILLGGILIMVLSRPHRPSGPLPVAPMCTPGTPGCVPR